MIEIGHPNLPIYRQCELLGLNRSSYYYKPAEESPYNLLLMNLIDRRYTLTPYYGVPRMTDWLYRQGHQVNRKRVARLMNLMGIEAIYPKPKTSRKNKEHKIYPYLLKGLPIERVNQVWATDITYIRMAKGFVYLVAIMDWFSRYVLSWSISNTMDLYFCLEALDAALSQATPEIFNSDQGSQFTSPKFTGMLTDRGVKVSMDGRGRVFDNIMIERLWRSVKYEEVYLKDYRSVDDVIQGIGSYFELYNQDRAHQSLGRKFPRQVYLTGLN